MVVRTNETSLQRALCHHANYQLFAIPTVNKSSIPISVGWTRDDGEIFKCHSDPRSNATFHSPDTASLTSGRPTDDRNNAQVADGTVCVGRDQQRVQLAASVLHFRSTTSLMMISLR
jgi:hypothetical protein